jgi:hypothetical protein
MRQISFARALTSETEIDVCAVAVRMKSGHKRLYESGFRQCADFGAQIE